MINDPGFEVGDELYDRNEIIEMLLNLAIGKNFPFPIPYKVMPRLGKGKNPSSEFKYLICRGLSSNLLKPEEAYKKFIHALEFHSSVFILINEIVLNGETNES